MARKTKAEHISPNQFMQLAIDLQALERKAFELNLFETARAINSAMNKIGWERAERIRKFADTGAVL